MRPFTGEDSFHAPRRIDTMTSTPLLDALYEAHAKAAADNANASKLAAVQAYQGSGDIGKAIMAGICTLGHLHAPLMQAYALLDALLGPEVFDYVALENLGGRRVPGFGNSFHPGGDPAFFGLRELLQHQHGFGAVGNVEARIRQKANAAMYTAMVCRLENLPPEAGMLIFIQARTPVWVQACLDNPPPRLWDGQT